jgi:hypothetical protein
VAHHPITLETEYNRNMNTASYDAAIKRTMHLQGLYRDQSISYAEILELSELQEATQQYEDARDAEAQAEYEFMLRFEDAFMAHQDR